HFAATLDEDLGRTAYEVVLTPGGALEWVEGNARHDSEPGVGALRRAWIRFLGLLPIDWLL
ncbi:MAG TPA: phospholipase D family protein, partial [Burkholderiales bacterium]